MVCGLIYLRNSWVRQRSFSLPEFSESFFVCFQHEAWCFIVSDKSTSVRFSKSLRDIRVLQRNRVNRVYTYTYVCACLSVYLFIKREGGGERET